MKKYISIGFCTGGNYFRPASTKNKIVRAKSTGFGDMICEVSNMIYRDQDCDLLRFKYISGTCEFIKLADKPVNLKVTVDESAFESFRKQAWDQESFSEVSGRETLYHFIENEYVSLNAEMFETVNDLPDKYITSQWSGNSKRALLPKSEADKIEKSYGLPVINHAQLQSLKNMSQLAYVIANAEHHIGCDSGLLHFAHCVLPRDRVRAYIPKGQLTTHTRAQLKNGYEVIQL